MGLQQLLTQLTCSFTRPSYLQEPVQPLRTEYKRIINSLPEVLTEQQAEEVTLLVSQTVYSQHMSSGFWLTKAAAAFWKAFGHGKVVFHDADVGITASCRYCRNTSGPLSTILP